MEQIIARMRCPPPESFLVAAHRGLRWRGVPDNVSRAESYAYLCSALSMVRA